MDLTPTNAHLERRDLRAYHRKLQDFLIKCTNLDGIPYRRTRNSVILYPLDQSPSITVHARNSERQLRSLNQWYAKHGPTKPEVQVPAVSVVEDPQDGIELVVETPSVTEPEPIPDPHEDPDHWSQHYSDKGDPVEGFVTDGYWYRCTLCADTPDEFLVADSRGIGGHRRMKHSDTTAMFGPEAREKATDTRRFNRLSRQIEESITTLAHSIGWQVGPDQSARLAELELENADLRQRCEEAEARLALLREAMGA